MGIIIFYLAATLLFYSVNCILPEEIFSAVEEVEELAENEAILIKEVKNLNFRLEHAIELVESYVRNLIGGGCF